MNKWRARFGFWLMEVAYWVLPQDERRMFDVICYYGGKVLSGLSKLYENSSAQSPQAVSSEQLQSLLDQGMSVDEALARTRNKSHLH